ncbi:hypothetical protein BD410DRAFT_804858 [Rickenella mellea]|uniref:DUF6533 domain-containing protein n=1 Tax=Rickenella mellea TaxID=50990 RepID=A0A4Y7Q082_9AGAM|nr:hypothetical protein BD410DRAFT_804858 [Rickenella mellea]
MSDSSPDIAGLTAEASQILFNNRIVISGTALAFYDYAMTFPTEVSEIWSAKFSGAQALFFMTRYSFIVYMVSSDYLQYKRFKSRASNWIIQLILAILGLTGAANVAVGVYFMVLTKPEVNSSVFDTCDEKPMPIFLRLELVSTIIALILDVLVFTLTFAKTIHHAAEMRKAGLGNGLGYFILRDVGTIVFFAPVSDAIGTWLDVLTAMSNPLTFILINRLVLNLRQMSHTQVGNASTLGAIGTIEEPAFAANSLLGNLGAPLRVGPDDEIEEIWGNEEVEVVEERKIVGDTKIIEEPRHTSAA